MVNNRLIKIIWNFQMRYLKSGEKFSINIKRENKKGDKIRWEVLFSNLVAKNMPSFVLSFFYEKKSRLV